MRIVVLAAMAVAMLAGGARAEVLDEGAYGFRLKTVQQIAAPPAKVWSALGEIGRWWSADHTYSLNAANLSLPLSANACYCEAVPPGGSIRHGVVEAVLPNQLLRIETSLGPLQDEGVTGALAFQLKAKDGGTELTTTYNVGGARDFIVSAAPTIDRVIGEQLTRLKSYVETGKPK